MSQQQMQDEEAAYKWSCLQGIRDELTAEEYQWWEQRLGFGGKSKAAEIETGKEFWND